MKKDDVIILDAMFSTLAHTGETSTLSISGCIGVWVGGLWRRGVGKGVWGRSVGGRGCVCWNIHARIVGHLFDSKVASSADCSGHSFRLKIRINVSLQAQSIMASIDR